MGNEKDTRKKGKVETQSTAEEMNDATNKNAQGTDPQDADMGGLDEEMLRKISEVRARLREGFGVVVMGMMMLPRYRHQPLSDLQQLVLEPLVRDRIAIAYPGRKEEGKASDDIMGRDITGMAIWASVSEEVDARIREQIKAGVFPVRLKPEDWTSGNINWLLDVIAPDPRVITAVIANFRQVVGQTELRLHPVVARMLDTETLEKLGIRRKTQSDDGAGDQTAATGRAETRHESVTEDADTQQKKTETEQATRH